MENYLGPQLADSAIVANRTNNWIGGNNPFNPARITDDTVAAFQAATVTYVLRMLVPPARRSPNAQVAALFGITASNVDDSELGAGPYTGAAILADASGYPGNGSVLNFANVTPTTIAAFLQAALD